MRRIRRDFQELQRKINPSQTPTSYLRILGPSFAFPVATMTCDGFLLCSPNLRQISPRLRHSSPSPHAIPLASSAGKPRAPACRGPTRRGEFASMRSCVGLLDLRAQDALLSAHRTDTLHARAPAAPCGTNISEMEKIGNQPGAPRRVYIVSRCWQVSARWRNAPSGLARLRAKRAGAPSARKTEAGCVHRPDTRPTHRMHLGCFCT